MHNKEYVTLYKRELAKAVGMVNPLLLTLASEAVKPSLYAMIVVTRTLIAEVGDNRSVGERRWDDIYQRINPPMVSRSLFGKVWDDIQNLKEKGVAGPGPAVSILAPDNPLEQSLAEPGPTAPALIK